MRLGTSGFGVIALVSLLVTATPEGNESGSKDPPEGKISWPVSVVRVTSTNDQTRSRFVKIKNDREDSSSRGEISSIPLWPFSHPPIVRAKDRRRDEAATEVSRFPNYLLGSSREPRLALNFKRSLKYPSNDLSEDNALGSFADEQSEYKVRSDTNVVTVVSSSRKFGEKFLVTLDSPISNFMRIALTPRSFAARRSHAPRRRDGGHHRRRERETIRRDEETKSLDRYDDKESTREKNQLTTERSRNEERSSTVKSAITMSHGITTMTSRTNKSSSMDRSLMDVNFWKATERYESQIMRNFPEPVSNNSSGNTDEYPNDETEFIFNSTPRTISRKPINLANSNNSFMANYPPVKHSKVLMVDITEDAPVVDRSNDRENRDVKGFATGDSRTDKLTNYVTNKNLSSDLNPNGSRDENIVRDLDLLKEAGVVSTPRTLIELTIRKYKTPLESTVTEEIAVRTRQITQESFLEVPIIGTKAWKPEGNVRDTNPIDMGIASLVNHKAIRVRSFQTTSDENEKQGDIDSDTSSLLSRSSSDHFHHKGEPLQDEETSSFADKIATSQFGVNQISFGKSSYLNTKNSSKPLINFLDGKSNKTFYEIKPSVITDMDRPDELDFPTTTRQSFDKFLLSSVPSVFGKFGPYFLDKEDGRNVTKRIGSTVQLDCRIGFLGNRTVTWLRHYIDSFRLLTVNQASYSVDRRISLKFTYPDNWRLQIAYASMRDSGLYKCQVEIDPNKSLVKKYNVIITAPILTITDDSGRPVSGERHLKAGSTLKLRCEARDVMQGLNESVLWMRGDETLTDDVSENRTTEIVNEREVTIVISTLSVDKAIPRHGGNYSCVVPDKAKTTIAVHVLNGELPAAVQHGSGVSTAVLNIWLVHLTASYGFFR